MDNELGKMQLIGITANERDNETGEKKKVTSVMCFRVDVDAPTGNDGMRMSPSLGVILGVFALVAASIAL